MGPEYGWLALALGAALLPDARDRRLAGAGLLVLGLGLAAYRAGSAIASGPLPSPRGLEPGFLVVNGGLLLGGLGTLLWAALSRGLGRRRLPALAVTALGTVLVGWASGALLLAAGPARAAAAAVSLALGCAVVAVLARRIASLKPAQAIGRSVFASPLSPSLPAARPRRLAVIGFAIGTAAVVLGNHVAVIALGVLVGAWAGYLAFRVPQSVPIAPLFTLLLLPAYRLLFAIAGPVELGLGSFPLIPLSPAAERLLALLLLPVAWALTGLWPLQRQMAGALTGLLGGLLLLRFAIPLTATGMEHWRPLMVPLIVAGLWQAAIRSRWPLVAAGAGLLGLVGSTLEGAVGAVWLYGAGLVLELRSVFGLKNRWARLIDAGAVVAAAWGGLLVLGGGLRGEVVYTALGALGLAIILAAGSDQPMIASMPKTPSAMV